MTHFCKVVPNLISFMDFLRMSVHSAETGGKKIILVKTYKVLLYKNGLRSKSKHTNKINFTDIICSCMSNT